MYVVLVEARPRRTNSSTCRVHRVAQSASFEQPLDLSNFGRHRGCGCAEGDDTEVCDTSWRGEEVCEVCHCGDSEVDCVRSGGRW
jgi:hypothetical protein